MRSGFFLLTCCLAAFCGACAFDVIHVEQHPVRLESACADATPFELVADVTLAIGYGYERTLKAGTKWRCIGRLAQGDVYTSRDQVLTVEASNIHEAYLVVDSRNVVGFYLPVEKTFSPLGVRRELPMKARP